MNIAIVRQGQILGYVQLEDGHAVPDDQVAELLAGVVVKDREGHVDPAEGERYLNALPGVLTGPQLWANVVDSVTAAALNYDGPGGMIALYPTEEQAKAVARAKGEPWQDLHVTLFFFEDANDLPDELYLEDEPALHGTLSGIARFVEGEDGVPVVALPSVVGLNELRAYLATQLEGYSERYGFIPHLTLGYGEVVDPEGVLGMEVTFDHVCVATKDGRKIFPLAK